MKVKQIVEDQQSLYPGMAPGTKQKFTVAPNTVPSAPGQPKTVTLVPQGSAPGVAGQPTPGSITVAQDQIDMTDPANPKIDPKAMQSQQQVQQPGALNNKTVTMGLGEEPNEDVLAGGAGLETKPGRDNTFKVSMQGGKPAALMGGTGPQIITPSSKWPTLTPEVEAKLKTQYFQVVYLNANGKMIPAASGGGKLYVGSQDYPSLTAGSAQTGQPLQQEEQGEANSLSRIAHLAGIK